MNDKKYLLTISVMTSNRKDTLPKTLKSLKPILDNVSSELIITDTGCDEELLAIIRQYTDKIVKFEWCKDFSKARNVSVDIAQGQWYMYVDDDEWFEDVTPIIEFFNSGEYRKYKAFDYIQRNYYDMEGVHWCDSSVSRATVMYEGMRFVDVIHEHFSISMMPIKAMNVYVHHYGYVFDDEEKMREHSKRNLTLLEMQLKEGKHGLRQYMHMLQEYNGLKNYEKAYEMALQGLKKAEESGEQYKKYESALRVNVAHSLYGMHRDEEAVDWIKEQLRKGNMTKVAYCAINGLLACTSFNIGDGLGTIAAAMEYFEWYGYIQGGGMQIICDSILCIGNTLQPHMQYMVFNMALMSAVLADDKVSVESILRYRDYVVGVQALDNGKWLTTLIEIMAGSNDKSIYASVVASYMDDIQCAAKICNKILDIKEQNGEVFMDIVANIVATKRDNPSVKMLTTIYNGLKGEIHE